MCMKFIGVIVHARLPFLPKRAPSHQKLLANNCMVHGKIVYVLGYADDMRRLGLTWLNHNWLLKKEQDARTPHV